MRSSAPRRWADSWRVSSRVAGELIKIVVACLAACFYSLSLNLRNLQAQTPPNCTQPILGQAYTWPQNSDIRINISSDFSPEQFGCIRQAFVNWANNPNTGAGVRYVQLTHGGTAFTGANTIYVARTPPPLFNGTQPQAQMDPTFNSTNTNLNSVLFRVHPDVTNCTALTEAMAHEIGHTYGLDDCPACPLNSSTMTGYNGMNDTGSGSTSPSNCDADRARQAGTYNTATARAPQPREPNNGGYSGGYNNQGFTGFYGTPNYTCYAAFMVTTYYSCGSSGCSYVGQTSSFMGINCY